MELRPYTVRVKKKKTIESTSGEIKLYASSDEAAMLKVMELYAMHPHKLQFRTTNQTEEDPEIVINNTADQFYENGGTDED